MSLTDLPPGRKLKSNPEPASILLTSIDVLVTSQTPEDTYGDMLCILKDHGLRLPREVLKGMFEVLRNCYQPFPVPFTTQDYDRQHTLAASLRLREIQQARTASAATSGSSSTSGQGVPTATAQGDSFSSRPLQSLPQSSYVSTDDSAFQSGSIASAVPPITKNMPEEYSKSPKDGPPVDVNTSFSWSHEQPSFGHMNPGVDCEAYGKPEYMKRAASKSAKKTAGADAARRHASEQAEVDRVARASETKMSSAVKKHNSTIESQYSGDTRPFSQPIPTIEITEYTPSDTQETSTQGTSTSFQSQVSPLSTPDTVYTANSTQSSQSTIDWGDLCLSNSTIRAKKVPVSAAHVRRSLRLPSSEPLVPENISLGKRLRDSEESVKEAGRKKSMTEYNMAKLSTPGDEL